MASASCLRLPEFFCHGKSFELQGRKLRASALSRSNNNEKEQEIYCLSRSNLPCGALRTLYFCSSQVPLTRWFLSRALSLAVSSTDSNQTNSESVPFVAPMHSPQMEFNKVNCLLWVLHESARSFSLAIQAHELTRNHTELAMAWVGVDVQAWHKRIAYQVAVYALLKAVIEVELFLSHKHYKNSSPVNEILSPMTNCLGESIESQLNIRHPKLVQWFRMVELPRMAGLFIPLFKKWSMEYARSGVAGIILAISCCAAVKKLGSGRVSCSLLSASIEDILAHLMDLLHSLVSLDKLHHLASEAGFEEDFLIHFGKKVLPGKNIEEVEFWIGLVQKKLSTAFHRESVISGKQIFCDKVQENSLATLGIFAYLGRETRLFLSGIGIKDLDENVKDFLSYLECGSLFVYPEFSSLSEYQLFMEVVTDEIEWLDFYASFSSIFNQERRRSKQQAIQAEKETILYTVLTVCYDVFSGFAHVSNSTQQPLDASLLSFLLRSQSLLSICLEGYWAAHDKSSALLRISERIVSDSLPSQIEGRTNPSANSEVNPESTDLIKSGIHQHRSQLIQDTNSAGLDPITLGKVGSAAESEPLHKSLLRKSTIKLISTTADVWMGTQLLCIDILDSLELLMKQLRGHKVTKRERGKIQRTLADIASLIPITILMLLPVSAVGHAAMFAAIQKYMPGLVPTPYSSERLDIVKQLKRAKKMEVQSLNNIKDDASNL
ncbi:uncharacterized protein LOC127789538 isoform X2 [Diospyros lotus]|uniref:uncharacterized protein LOC127789538 isoform X2 n=1 Tax=Diospyros lotus TaxID=55363 RepID=UPI002259C96F|nr:uncharacterized protein LOC127789538 isoform X2 [Diospyros lotus]